MEPAELRVGSTTPPGWSGYDTALKRNIIRSGPEGGGFIRPVWDLLTNVSQVDEAVLADVGAGAGLRGDDGAGAALFVADDAELRRLDSRRQVHVKNRAQLL